MSAIRCSAPGKLFLGGEYAVLSGAEAVVTAVNRRAIGKPVHKPSGNSPVLVEARQRFADFLSRERGAPQEIVSIRVDSPNFKIRHKKIGLGSSAAVSATACGVFFEWAGLPIVEHRSQILDMATSAHSASQGGRGSGADVATSVLGGTIIFSIDGRQESIDLSGIELVAVWSGRTASTTVLVEQIEAFSRRDPEVHRACFEELHQGAADLAQAYRTGEPSQIITWTERYGESMNRLGQTSGAPIATSEHQLIAHLAHSLGGASKPSGAGGGDVAVAVFQEPEAANRFRSQVLRHGFTPLDIKLGAQGLRRDNMNRS
ncbi:MAG: hypothetical protein GY847_13625 [Proteobacteria bacterium]|nr:hypothetical protein [Pseudomonadota bacterium]